MAVSIYRLSEQILLRLKDGKISSSTSIEIPDIKLRVGQVINKLFKTEVFSVNMPSDVTIPSGCMVAEYTVAVSAYKDLSKATLPVMPIALPRDMGVLEVYALNGSGNYTPSQPIIPIQSGQEGLMSDFLSDLISYSYRVKGQDLIFNTDLTAHSISNVLVRLVVMDVNSIGDFDPLPIPSEMEETVIEMVYQSMIPQIKTTTKVDSISE